MIKNKNNVNIIGHTKTNKTNFMGQRGSSRITNCLI